MCKSVIKIVKILGRAMCFGHIRPFSGTFLVKEYVLCAHKRRELHINEILMAAHQNMTKE
jgi:hypothetical protein